MSANFTATVSQSEEKEYYERKYNTVCSIINAASQRCGVVLNLMVSVVISVLTIFFTALLSSDNEKYTLNQNVSVFLACIFLLVLAFMLIHYNAYKMQYIYRELKEKIEKDIASQNFFGGIAVRDDYYKMLLDLFKTNYLFNKLHFKKVIKELFLYLFIMMVTLTMIITVNLI